MRTLPQPSPLAQTSYTNPSPTQPQGRNGDTTPAPSPPLVCKTPQTLECSSHGSEHSHNTYHLRLVSRALERKIMLFSGQFITALTYVTNKLDLDRFPVSIVPVFPLGRGGGAGVVNVLVDAPEHPLLVNHRVGAPFALLIEEQIAFIAVLVDWSSETTILHKGILAKILFPRFGKLSRCIHKC